AMEGLADLRTELQRWGGHLWVQVGQVVDVLDQLHRHRPFAALHAHEETGNGWTYARDLAVGRWCGAHGVAWREWPQFGVVRKLAHRDSWQRRWEAFMAQARPSLPQGGLAFVEPPCPSVNIPSSRDLGLPLWQPPGRQRGGRQRGLSVLRAFLDDGCARYRGHISSPLSAPTACSRLSPYLAQGQVSLREVVQATRSQLEAETHAPPGPNWRKQGLSAFMSRLYWHCHFIQKLETEPSLEFQNLHRGYDGLREPDWNPAHFEALVQGRTGWPMVDACVAMLHETGWLNFRMRAMLVSVAAYPLWLHWREVGHWLAREFLDYEPGIHWSQLQMQSGTTGINTTRVYNPIKQARDHDPQGVFVRRWLPALRRVPDSWLFEPWRMPPDVQNRCGVQVGVDLAMPLVDLEQATRLAKSRLYAVRARPDVRAAKAAIVEKHASRQGMPGGSRNAQGREVPAARRRAVESVSASQLALDF
ncbi:MAG: hypothetical protein RI959_1259, partial [Pseudomonadota bacterium]